MEFAYFRLVYDIRGDVTCHDLIVSSRMSTDPSFSGLFAVVAKAVAGGLKDVPIYFGSIRGAKLLFLPPAPLFELHHGDELLSLHLHLRGVNPQLEQLATDLFETKVRMIAPDVFQQPNPLKLVRLTRLPLAVTLRFPLASSPNRISALQPSVSMADISDIADELVLLAAYQNDRALRRR